MRANPARRDSEKEQQRGTGNGTERSSVAHASVGATALPVLKDGVGIRRIDHKPGSKVVSIVKMLLDAGEIADVDTDEALIEIACRGLHGWLEKSWGRMKYFELNFTLCDHILNTVDGTDGGDEYAADRLREAVKEDFGVDVGEKMVAFQVGTAGQRWTRIGPKVKAIEEQEPGLGWDAVKAIGEIGSAYGMLDLEFMERAASEAYWGQGDSEEDWAECFGEDLDQFGGMTRAEFDSMFPLKEMRASKRLGVSKLRKIAKRKDDCGEVARRLLALQKLGLVRPAFRMDACDEECGYYQNMDAGVVIEWMETAPVVRIVDDFMANYQNSGDGTRDWIGAIALRIDGANAMMALTEKWKHASAQLRHADAILGMLAEDDNESR